MPRLEGRATIRAMELSSLLMFWLLLASALVVTAVTYFRPRFRQETIAWETAVGLMALVGLVWYWLGRELPLNRTAASPLSLVWHLDEMGWQLSGVWLLLVTAVVVAGGWRLGVSDLSWANRYSLSVSLHFTAAGLLPLLAGNLAALLLAVTLLIGVWSAVLWLLEPSIHEDVTRLLSRAVWLMLSLLFIWLAAAFSPDLNSLNMVGWPRLAASSVLVAALLLLGYWPFHGWRLADWQLPVGMMTLLAAAPALTGLAVLARLVAGTDVGMGYSLFLTLFGLLGVFMGVRRAWGAESPSALAGTVALVQANLAGLALVWVGPEVVVGEARVLVLAVSLVLFMGRGLTQINADFGFLGQVGLLVALAGLSGMPLLAGFTGRAGLYAAWLGNGRFILVLVAGLLQMLLVAAVSVAVGRWELAARKEALTTRHSLLATLFLAAGMISWRGLAGVSIGVWLALLLPFGGGLALAYFVGETDELRQIIRRAFVVDLPLDGVKQKVGWLVGWLETAVQDAATIWEGEGGLLWLLALLIGLLVVGGW
ncbi:MAG: hypothetical protein H6667_03875 [Ardenticatenaceae bacterium]|nr:hypothetical protein [Ardenticatenaceae bacterium]